MPTSRGQDERNGAEGPPPLVEGSESGTRLLPPDGSPLAPAAPLARESNGAVSNELDRVVAWCIILRSSFEVCCVFGRGRGRTASVLGGVVDGGRGPSCLCCSCLSWGSRPGKPACQPMLSIVRSLRIACFSPMLYVAALALRAGSLLLRWWRKADRHTEHEQALHGMS